MSSISWLRRARLSKREIALIAALAIVCAIAVRYGNTSAKPFASAEVKFTDASAEGLHIVPASCPSDPHYDGECSPYPVCGVTVSLQTIASGDSVTVSWLTHDKDFTPPGAALLDEVNSSGYVSGSWWNSGSGSITRNPTENKSYTLEVWYSNPINPQDITCSATVTVTAPPCTPQNICGSATTVNNSCTNAVVTNCVAAHAAGWTCSSGACIPPPGVEFTAFTGINGSGGTFNATGHLEVVPGLVRRGDTTHVFWNTTNAASCTVTEDNPDFIDAWSFKSSGASGQTTHGITQRTIYTLNCTALPGASPATVTEHATVSVIPTFQEI